MTVEFLESQIKSLEAEITVLKDVVLIPRDIQTTATGLVPVVW